MKLPRHELATVRKEKVTSYLLSDSHRDGRSKAAFFKAFGFRAERWRELADALLRHAASHEVAKQEVTEYGERFVVEGTMETPDGRDPQLRSVWFIAGGGGFMIHELDTVVLTADLPEYGLKAGDLGTVVLVHSQPGYEVEFLTLDGKTLAVVSLSPRQVRPVAAREIAQARLVGAA